MRPPGKTQAPPWKSILVARCPISNSMPSAPSRRIATVAAGRIGAPVGCAPAARTWSAQLVTGLSRSLDALHRQLAPLVLGTQHLLVELADRGLRHFFDERPVVRKLPF